MDVLVITMTTDRRAVARKLRVSRFFNSRRRTSCFAHYALICITADVFLGMLFSTLDSANNVLISCLMMMMLMVAVLVLVVIVSHYALACTMTLQKFPVYLEGIVYILVLL